MSSWRPERLLCSSSTWRKVVLAVLHKKILYCIMRWFLNQFGQIEVIDPGWTISKWLSGPDHKLSFSPKQVACQSKLLQNDCQTTTPDSLYSSVWRIWIISRGQHCFDWKVQNDEQQKNSLLSLQCCHPWMPSRKQLHRWGMDEHLVHIQGGGSNEDWYIAHCRFDSTWSGQSNKRSAALCTRTRGTTECHEATKEQGARVGRRPRRTITSEKRGCQWDEWCNDCYCVHPCDQSSSCRGTKAWSTRLRRGYKRRLQQKDEKQKEPILKGIWKKTKQVKRDRESWNCECNNSANTNNNRSTDASWINHLCLYSPLLYAGTCIQEDDGNSFSHTPERLYYSTNATDQTAERPDAVISWGRDFIISHSGIVVRLAYQLSSPSCCL